MVVVITDHEVEEVFETYFDCVDLEEEEEEGKNLLSSGSSEVQINLS